MEKVIITGADGFVGSYTVKYFLEQGKTVLAVGRAETPKRLPDNERLTYLQCDVSNSANLLNKISSGVYDSFLHFAWAGSAGPARIDYGLQMRNALDTVECLKAAKELGCTRFVCAGSIMEREVEAAVHAQGSKPGMGYIYGMGKYIAHCMCKAVAANIGIDLVWALITNAYGPEEYSPRFINITLRKIINGEPLRFTAATQNYDFVYVTDVAKAFYLLAEKGRPFCEYLIGSGNAKPLKEFILEMGRECAPDAELQFGDLPFTGTNLPLNAYDISAIQNDCGFHAEISFSEGIHRTLEWLKTLQEVS